MAAVAKKALTLCALVFAMPCLRVPAQMPELVVQTGHSNGVASLAFNSHDRILASEGSDEIIIWDLSNGRELRSFPDRGVSCLTFSPDGRTLASGKSGSITLWDPASGREIRTLAMGRDGQHSLAVHTDSIDSLAFSPDGRLLASEGEDNNVRLWDVLSTSSPRTLAPATKWFILDELKNLHKPRFASVMFSPDGHALETGSFDYPVRRWDVVSGRELSVPGDGKSINPVAFSPDGSTVASGRSDNTFGFWDVSTSRELQELHLPSASVNFLAFSPEGLILAANNLDGTIDLWDVAGGGRLRTLVGRSKRVNFIAFSQDGLILASATAESTIELWSVASGQRFGVLATRTNKIFSVSFSSDGEHLASGSRDEAVKLWDFGGKPLLQTLAGHTSGVQSLAFSPDGRRLAAGNSNRAIILWDVFSGRQLRSLAGDQTALPPVFTVAFSPDQRTMAAGDLQNTVRLWDVATGRELRHLVSPVETRFRPKEHQALDDRIEQVAFSPDGRFLAASSGIPSTVTLWEAASGRLVQVLHGGQGMGPSFAFSPDGHTMVVETLTRLVIWDVATAHKVYTLPKQLVDSYFAFVFGPEGHSLAALNMSGTIDLWDLVNRRELRRPEVHGVRSIAFSAERNILALGDSDGTIKLWDVVSGREMASLVAFGQNDWLVSDLDGHFDTSNLDEINGLSWVFPDEPFRALAPEIFMRDYYVPDLLSKVLTGGQVPQVRSLSSLNRAQPQVEVTKIEPESGGELVDVTVKVISTNSEVQNLQSGVYDLHLLRDGQLVGQWPDVSQAKENLLAEAGAGAELQAWRSLHQISLVNGENVYTFHGIHLPRCTRIDKVQFTAYAFNSDRVKSVTTPSLSYSLPKSAVASCAALPRRAYLISIGVNANQSRWNLDLAVPSAQHASRLLHEKLATNYDVIDLSLFSTLADDSPRVMLQQATKANLEAVLDLLAGRAVDNNLRDAVDPDHKLRRATPDDAVVLFIASHGYADQKGTFYVVPYDTGVAPGVTEDLLTHCQVHTEDHSPQCERANSFLGRTISSREFAAWWAGIDAGEMMMMLDSCHSAAAPGREFRPGPLGDAGLGQLSYDKGMRILTATQPDKTARATLVQELGHSLLVEAMLEEAKIRPEETLPQWLHGTEQQVPALAHRLYPELSASGLQLPKLFDFNVAERHQLASLSADLSR